MSFHEFYQKWQDREIKIKFRTIKDRLQYYINWIWVILTLGVSMAVYHLSYHGTLSNLVADVFIACSMCVFLYLVLFGTKLMKKRRCRLYENHRIFIETRSR
ncbi:hypothetical protein [[Eubacterium] hominis]|uniref:hypothetical protein n=1 Tax=[Eubacterium] hominis TaxID=2764325 RepID=UPI003A4D7C5A